MRSAKETENFPYNSKLICYIEVDNNGNVAQIANSKTEKTAAYNRAVLNQSKLYAVWPGQWRSDLFAIDDLNLFADKCGIPRNN